MTDDKTQPIRGKISPNPDVDEFWITYGKKKLEESISSLDERAKFMVTTCAGLIVVNFGLLVAFSTGYTLVKVTPQFFFVVSAALFALSYFPIRVRFNLASPNSVEDIYYISLKWRHICHIIGFIFFISGLMAIALMQLNLVSSLP